MTQIKWIFFDIGGVLGDESRFTDWRLDNNLSIIQKYRPDFTHANIMQVFPRASSIVGSLDINIINIALENTQFQKRALEDLKISKAQMPDYYNLLQIRSESMEVLKQLSKRYKLGIMANQHARVRDKLEQARILQFFEHVGVSDDYHLEKPNLDFFRNVFRDTGADPKESVLIDDNIERGLVPAKIFGMKTVWYKLRERNDFPVDAVDFDISDLRGLLKIF